MDHVGEEARLDPGNRYVDRALQKSGTLTPQKIRSLGIVSFIYAGLFLTEGIGLWLVKRWAEWFSVIITTSLVPVEVYEIYRHPSAIKSLVLVLNIAVVGYLLYGFVAKARAQRGLDSDLLFPGIVASRCHRVGE